MVIGYIGMQKSFTSFSHSNQNCYMKMKCAMNTCELECFFRFFVQNYVTQKNNEHLQTAIAFHNSITRGTAD